jgi:hypothetical protein
MSSRPVITANALNLQLFVKRDSGWKLLVWANQPA